MFITYEKILVIFFFFNTVHHCNSYGNPRSVFACTRTNDMKTHTQTRYISSRRKTGPASKPRRLSRRRISGYGSVNGRWTPRCTSYRQRAISRFGPTGRRGYDDRGRASDSLDGKAYESSSRCASERKIRHGFSRGGRRRSCVDLGPGRLALVRGQRLTASRLTWPVGTTFRGDRNKWWEYLRVRWHFSLLVFLYCI